VVAINRASFQTSDHEASRKSGKKDLFLTSTSWIRREARDTNLCLTDSGEAGVLPVSSSLIPLPT
jgi:hypothetical protein